MVERQIVWRMKIIRERKKGGKGAALDNASTNCS